jgi:tetratricopeptide (TPR) repeat protein
MLVTTPFVLMLLDYWPLGRLQKASQFSGLLKEKIPLFAFAILASVGEIIAARRAIQPIGHIPVLPRLCNAAVAYIIYIGKLVHPSRLAVYYPLPEGGWGAWQVTGACLILAAFSAGAWRLRRKQPYLLVGWLWYLGMLAPVIGILQTGLQAYADRFTYLPQIGLCFAGTWAAADWAGGYPRRRVAMAGAAAAILLLFLVTAIRQTSYWRDSLTLWTHTFACTEDNALTRFTLGDALSQQGRTEEAISQYREALRINPTYVDAHINLGIALDQQGQTGEALGQYREAVQINPDRADSHLHLGNALARQRRTEEAIAEYREAVRADPGLADAHYNLGKALAQEGQTGEAIAEYREALRINPDSAEAHNNLGIALARQGQMQEAIDQIQKALELQPSSLSRENNLAWMLATAPQASLRNGRKALELAMKANEATGGGNPNVAQTLAAAYAEAGEFPDAVRTAQKALQMAEDNSNNALASELRRELELYKAGRRFEAAR